MSLCRNGGGGWVGPGPSLPCRLAPSSRTFWVGQGSTHISVSFSLDRFLTSGRFLMLAGRMADLHGKPFRYLLKSWRLSAVSRSLCSFCRMKPWTVIKGGGTWEQEAGLTSIMHHPIRLLLPMLWQAEQGPHASQAVNSLKLCSSRSWSLAGNGPSPESYTWKGNPLSCVHTGANSAALYLPEFLSLGDLYVMQSLIIYVSAADVETGIWIIHIMNDQTFVSAQLELDLVILDLLCMFSHPEPDDFHLNIRPGAENTINSVNHPLHLLGSCIIRMRQNGQKNSYHNRQLRVTVCPGSTKLASIFWFLYVENFSFTHFSHTMYNISRCNMGFGFSVIGFAISRAFSNSSFFMNKKLCASFKYATSRTTVKPFLIKFIAWGSQNAATRCHYAVHSYCLHGDQNITSETPEASPNPQRIMSLCLIKTLCMSPDWSVMCCYGNW